MLRRVLVLYRGLGPWSFFVQALDDWSFCLTKQLTTEITVADFTIHTKDSAPAYQPLAESHRLWHRTSYTKPQHAHLKRKET